MLRLLDLRECDNLEECRDSENITTNNTTFIEEETSSSVPVELNFSNCKRLRSIPESIGKLKYPNLHLSECPNLEKFPEISSGGMECLHELSLNGTGIKELPESIENIKKLKQLTDCTSMKTISSCEAAHIHNGQYFGGLLPMVWSRVPFVVCIVGVLNNFDDDDHDKRMRAVLLKYNINFKTNTCDGHRHKYIGGLAKTCLQANNRNADHVFIMHNRDMSLDKQVLRQLIRPRGCLNLRNVDALQASFSICLMEGASVNLNIKNCGIRFIYDYDRTKVRQY
ncbi:hypothetical protein FEM48_Zijuj04G0140600 [Ziziphus jujuba var. spinosa]|uniref:Uncharacterized protein n=1 Tax=Ziziphus jujuba var. spinosa TaxID=714518 RepID=A0A978VKB0_ZIZJJ|nr:hypothetical protein FEM48_Zijuj04G0140600 [Ziziphus jujuba var. spinosa]